jgi:3-dehydroquinate synthase
VVHAAPRAGQARPVLEALAADHDVLALPVPDGESAKTARVAEECWEALGSRGFTRSDAVVAVGGGAVTDLGGFVAATWLRGVRVVHVPTTLLGMVDAAVGGKTGINTAAGKNLVGSFHEPAGVLCDLAALDTLPRPDFVAGLAEVVKCGFVADPEILELVERHEPSSLAPGHAVERHEGYRMRHGEAVAIGCVYAAELAGRAGVLDPAVVARHRAVLGRVGLPTRYDAAPFEDLHAAMRVDKKARGSRLRFVVLRDVADPVVLDGPRDDDLRAAYVALGGGAA